MFRLPSLIAAFFVSLVCPSALAQSGEQVLMRCLPAVKEFENQKVSREETEAARWCIGYVSGMIDGITLMTSHLSTRKICFPKEGVNSYQSIKLVTEWLKANPKELGESGRTSVVIALGTAFPCK